jgi:penicillin-binding protein 1A
MSEFQQTTDPHAPSPPDGDGATVVALYPSAPDGSEPPRQVKLKKLRLLLVLSGIGLLAAVSTVFGMMMAVASDLPRLEALDRPTANTQIVDRYGKPLGLLTGNTRRIFLDENDPIAPVMRQAIVAIEDRRFFTNPGVDLRGIGRALWQDIVAQKAVQGGSTITQQFVKNALEAQSERTLFQKLREAAMAFHMTKKWSKEKILRNYLNTIYFGNGAYGLESAARVYFGWNHDCGEGKAPCASMLEPHEAALIAGVVANPTGYDPLTNPAAATARRNLVLQRMTEQGYLSQGQYQAAMTESVPTGRDIQPPQENTEYPYFTSWVKQQVVEKLGGGQLGARRAFEGGLVVKTTIDSRLQDAAQAAVDAWLPPGAGPEAALVALDNRSGEVLAMVGGPHGENPQETYSERPFNLATQGQRQPGSSFKPFILAEALRRGISPNSVWSSRKKEFCVTRKGKRCVEAFQVNNYEDAYAGVTTLARATTFSDNSVYAELGIKLGTKKIARLAERMGVRTPVSTNYAMTLGGLREGVTVLDMAHAYQTFAQRGKLTYGTMSSGEWDNGRRPVPGPVGIREIRRTDDEGEPDELAELPDGEKAKNEVREKRVLPTGVTDQVQSILGGVVSVGTGTRAKISDTEPAYGKTGTTENYGDAWFVGWTERYTVAVWVGYPDKLVPMKTEFQGEPVAGGTFPAVIWRQFMVAALEIFADRHPEKEEDVEVAPTPALPAQGTATPVPEATTAPSGEGGGTPPAPEQQAPAVPETTQPEQPPAEPPAEEPPAAEPPPDDGGGGTEAPEGGGASGTGAAG